MAKGKLGNWNRDLCWGASSCEREAQQGEGCNGTVSVTIQSRFSSKPLDLCDDGGDVDVDDDVDVDVDVG